MRQRTLSRSIAAGMIVFAGCCLDAASAADPPDLVLQVGPEDSVTSMAVSPDGSVVATGSFDGRVRIYDARTGALRRAIGSDSSRGVRSLAFAPDGNTIASGGLEMDRALKIWDVRTGALVRAMAGHDTVGQLYAELHAVAFSPAGELIASAGRDGYVLVWDAKTGRLRHRLSAHRGAALSLAFAPGGEALASGGEDCMVRLWDLTNGRLTRALAGHRGAVCTLSFAPNGCTLASGGTDWGYHRGRDTARFTRADTGHESEWRLWDVATGNPMRTVTEPERVSSLAFSADGRSLACGVGRDVRLYDMANETVSRIVTSHDGGVTSLAFAPDGQAILSGSHDRTARRVSLATGVVEWRALGYWQQVNSVAISRDGNLIASGSSDVRFAQRELEPGTQGLGPGAVRLWDAHTGRLILRLGTPAEQVMAVALSPDGRLVASAGAGANGHGAIRAWGTATGSPIWSADDRDGGAIAIQFAPDGATLATAASHGPITLRDPQTGSVVRTLDGLEGGATSVAFSGDGSIVCGGGTAEGACLWEVRTGRVIGRIQPERTLPEPIRSGHERLITSVALSSDGRTLVTCSGSASPEYGDRQVRVWDARTGQFRREFSRPQSAGRFLTLSPDGKTLATNGTGKSIALWDVSTGRLVRELVGHPHPPQSAVFSADGRLLVSGADYRTTKVWEVGSGRLLASMVTLTESRSDCATEDWLAYTPDGFYAGSPDIDRYLSWRDGDGLRGPDCLGQRFHRPDRLSAALKPALPERDSHVVEPGVGAR